MADIPWFKVDDQLHSHPKARRASLAALGLWSMCGSYCMAYKTDGFVPHWFVASFPRGVKLAHELVDAGLWEVAVEVPESGWVFHDWTDYQPSSDEIEAEREAARDRQREWRRKHRDARSGKFSPGTVTPLVTRDVTRDSHRLVTNTTPSLPVPTRPIKTRVETSSSSSGSVPRARPRRNDAEKSAA